MLTREYLPFWLIYDDIRYFNLFLVGGIPTPLKNMTSSVGMMTFPTYGKSFLIPWFQNTHQL